MERELPYRGLTSDRWAGQRPLDEQEQVELSPLETPALGNEIAVSEAGATLPGGWSPGAPPAVAWGSGGLSVVDDTHPTNDTPADHQMTTVDPDYLEDDEP